MGERMEVRVKDGAFANDVQFETGDVGSVTLDSGAGVDVWPEDWLRSVAMMPRHEGLRMCAADGTEITNIGRKIIRFRGNDVGKRIVEHSFVGSSAANGRVERSIQSVQGQVRLMRLALEKRLRVEVSVENPLVD